MQKTQRNIPLYEVERRTGIAGYTLQSLANNKLPRYDAPVIMGFCNYLEIEVGDLIVYERK